MSRNFTIECGPFAEARASANEFGHNLFLSHTISKCVQQMTKIQAERDAATMAGDEQLIKEKELQLKTFQSSLTLTAYIFDEIDEIAT